MNTYAVAGCCTAILHTFGRPRPSRSVPIHSSHSLPRADAASEQPPSTQVRPELSFGQIWNMCFGFLGIQFGFALQTANISRIFQTLGASLEQIPLLWVAAPITGLLVQPVVGYCSDRTWTRLGRRRPYFLGGAVLATLALLWMPHATTLWTAAVLLWLMDGTFNVAMEPFRAFVADQLPERQRPRGYLMQSFFIGVGAVIASVAACHGGREQRGARRRPARHAEVRVLRRWRGHARRSVVDGAAHA